MAKGYIGSNTYKCFLGNVKMKKGYIGGTRVYSAGEIVTYIIDTGITKQEEVDEGSSTLSPKTFTPSKTGWTFIGWRSDKTANGSVLTSKIMGDSPITLYAVFRQTITVSYDGNGHTGGSTASQTGYRYYNNGNVANPSFTLQSNGFTKTNYSFISWTSGGTDYTAGQTISTAGNMTMTAKWRQYIYEMPSGLSVQKPVDWPLKYHNWPPFVFGSNVLDLTYVDSVSLTIHWKVWDKTYYYDDIGVRVGIFSRTSEDSPVVTTYSLGLIGESRFGSETYEEDITLTLDTKGLSGNYYVGLALIGCNSYDNGWNDPNKPASYDMKSSATVTKITLNGNSGTASIIPTPFGTYSGKETGESDNPKPYWNYAFSSTPINLTGVSSLTIDVSPTIIASASTNKYYYDALAIMVGVSNSPNSNTFSVAASEWGIYANQYKTNTMSIKKTISVSSLSGNYYVGVAVGAYNSNDGEVTKSVTYNPIISAVVTKIIK